MSTEINISTCNPEPTAPKSLPTLFISVIVPVRNESRHIEHVLDQLERQNYDPKNFEILVIDGLSTDGTPDLVAEYAKLYHNIHLFSNPQMLSSAARNIGIRHARGDVMLIIDGHCELDNKSLLKNISEAFQRTGADCLGRPQPQDIAGSTTLQRAIALARASRIGHHPSSYIYSSQEAFVPAESVAVAYRREVFDKVGLFDERFDACEDVDFNFRIDQADLKCFFTPDIAVHYQPRSSLRGLFQQLFRYGRGRVRLVRKHPSLVSAGTFAPLVLLLWLSFFFVLGLLYPEAFIVGAVTLLLYVSVLASGAIFLAMRNSEPKLIPYLFTIWTIIHFAAAFGMLGELPSVWRIRSISR
jgi:succinoglycan biosynthesis protein ExoA